MTRALMLIDLQLGAFDGLQCDAMPDGDPLIATCKKLLATARLRGDPVIWVQHSEGPGTPMDRKGPGFAIDPRLDPKAGELHLIKTEPNAFAGTSLQAMLKKHKIETLLIAGLQSELCVQATAEAAQALGIPTTVVRDGHNTWPHAGHSATEVRKRANEAMEDAGVTMMRAKDYI
jgi:nicotinamidase-related amidase